MFYKAKKLKGYKLHGLDGEIGRVEDFYFDDRHWTIRYLVADTGNWLRGRQVLISPRALVSVLGEEQSIAINLTRVQIEESPSLDTDKPVSRQFEEAYHEYYGWPMHWECPGLQGVDPNPAQDREQWLRLDPGTQPWDAHLRSADDVNGHHLQAMDGEIGHVEDFIIDDKTWVIRYLIIDTRNWWPGKMVLVSPQWIELVSWDESRVLVNLSREDVKRSPEYTADSLLTREYEAGLHRHYDRQGYWVDEPAAKEHVH